MSKKFLISITTDILFIVFLTGISAFFISFYFDANFLDIGYQDWLVHAYRIKFIAENGASSWTHTWSNGANIWQSYQFIPHIITYLLSLALKLDITRSMVLITIFIFIAVRVEIYIFLRLLHVKAIPSLIAALLTFTITNYWSGVSDFSLQFAYLVFPIILYLWVLYTRGRIQLIFPFLIGITMYIHPILTFFSVQLWIISLFVSTKKVFSFQTLVESLLIIVGASLFLFPYVFRDSYKFINPYFSTTEYLSMVLKNYQYKGLSIPLIIALIFSGIRAFLPVQKSDQWIRSLTIFSIASMMLILLSGNVELPHIISAFQFPRGAAIVGIGICFLSGEILNLLTKRGNLATYAAISLFIVYIFVDSIWTISVYSPQGTYNISDPVKNFSANNDLLINKRVFTPSLGSTSYYLGDAIRIPYSYLGQFDSNQIPPRLTALTIYSSYTNLSNSPVASMNRISDYLKVSATQYVLFDKFSPLTAALLNPSYELDYKHIGESKSLDTEYSIFEVPWKPIDASLIHPDLTNKISPFPTDVKFSNNNDFIELDQYIKNFANTISSEKNIPLLVAFPSQDRIYVKIPDNRISNLVYVATSHSTGWKASFNGNGQIITQAGPNFMAIHLDGSMKGGILSLKHSWPIQMIPIIVVIILTPFVILLYNLIFNRK